MINKEEVLKLIDSRRRYSKDMNFECCIEECDILTEEINNLPVSPIFSSKEMAEYINEDNQNRFEFCRNQDTELLQKCHNALNYLCFLDEYDTKKYVDLINELRERLDIK